MAGTQTRRVGWIVAAFLAALFVAAHGSFGARAEMPALRCSWDALAEGPHRTGQAMVGLPQSEESVLIYGGYAEGGAVASDAHVLSLALGAPGSWRTVPASGSMPGPRYRHVMALRVRPILGFEAVTFGGLDAVPEGVAVQATRSETHALDGLGRWRQIGALSSVARVDHAAVYWPDQDALLVLGGRADPAAATVVSDTLQLPLEGASPSWSVLHAAGAGPPARADHTAVHDAVNDRVVVFGGTADGAAGLDDLWALNLGGDIPTWARLEADGEAPSGRFDHAAAVMADHPWMVVFGGTNDGEAALDALHVLDLGAYPPTWRTVEVEGDAPGPRRDAAAAPGPVGVVLHGGHDPSGPLSDTWILRCHDEPEATHTASAPTPDASATATSATAQPTPSASPTEAPTDPTPDATDTPVATLEPTPEATATASSTPGLVDVDLHGLVFDASVGRDAPIVGATVRVPPCHTPHQPFVGVSGADGTYTVTLPAAYFAPGCTVTIDVSAAGYALRSTDLPYDEVAAQPQRDWGLTPLVPTPTPTDGPADVTMHGFVFDASIGPGRPIEGATVRVPPCHTPHQPFVGTSGSGGAYAVVLPAPYFTPTCTVQVEVSAPGFGSATWAIAFSDLTAQPRRDFGLVPDVDGDRLYLPALHRARLE